MPADSTPAGNGSGKSDAHGSSKKMKKDTNNKDANPFDGAIPRDKSGKPKLTPEMIEELTPQTAEIDRVRRKLLYVISGCGTLVVLAILAMLYIPYWQMTSSAEETARNFLEAAARGDVDEAMQYSGIRNADYVRRQVESLQEAIGDGGSFNIDGLEFVSAEPNDQTFVVGTLTPPEGPEIPFRLRVMWSSDHDGFAVYQGHIGDEAAQ